VNNIPQVMVMQSTLGKGSANFKHYFITAAEISDIVIQQHNDNWSVSIVSRNYRGPKTDTMKITFP